MANIPDESSDTPRRKSARKIKTSAQSKRQEHETASIPQEFEPLTEEEMSSMPPPVTGKWGRLLREGTNGSLALRWFDKSGQPVDAKAAADGLLAANCLIREKAIWLPKLWEIDVFPPGWDMPYLEAWFKYALIVAKDKRPRNDPEPKFHPTPKMLVHHAYLIVRHLGFEPPTPESSFARSDDRDGCMAMLEELHGFLRKSLTADKPSVKGGKQKGKRGRKADPDIDPNADRRLCENWKAAKGKGATRKEFCRANELTVSALIAAIDRERYRRRLDAELDAAKPK